MVQRWLIAGYNKLRVRRSLCLKSYCHKYEDTVRAIQNMQGRSGDLRFANADFGG